MQMTGNTILITGGGSGIGLGLAQAFHKLGNKVIIAGRRKETLAEAQAANPGMEGVTVDIADASDVKRFASEMTSRFPKLNVLINNAGMMKMEDATKPNLADVEATIETNLVAPIRLTAALLPHLRKQPRSAVMTVTSGLAFVPMASAATYCATKAALHSYTVSLRYALRGSTTQVIEIAPPYVQTTLTGDQQANDPTAMPLNEYIDEVMTLFKTQPDAKEIIVERCKPLRFAAENNAFDATLSQLNEAMAHRE